MLRSPKTRFDRDQLRVGALAAAVSVFSLLHFFQADQILSHGDAVAHINIARRVLDSLTPGPLQLGTVWLPLPHVLMIPFVWSNALWQSGIGGSIPSMIAYVLGVVGIFCLVRALLESQEQTHEGARGCAYVAACVYGANPDLIYTQTTALTETLYLAFFIWAMVYFARFLSGTVKGEIAIVRGSLWQCALCVGCAELTRYDGWFLAGVMGLVVLAMAIRRWSDRSFRRLVAEFFLSIALAPALWLGYNAAVYGNAFEFATGEYSAKAIEQRVAAPNPGSHNAYVAASYFLKSAQLVMAPGNWGRLWLAAGIVATVVGFAKLVREAKIVFVFLWSPLIFYALSIAYGSVLLHVPMWWPFAIFNQRYGLELLPMFAVSAGVLAAGLGVGETRPKWLRAAAVCALVALSYVMVWRTGSLGWREAVKSWETRRGMDTAVMSAVAGLAPGSSFLMDVGEHVGVMERLGIPLRRVVNSENQRPWKRPDPDGTWERALADPASYVDYVVVFQGDLVDRGVNRQNLTLMTEIHALGRPPARIYSTRRGVNQSR